MKPSHLYPEMIHRDIAQPVGAGMIRIEYGMPPARVMVSQFEAVVGAPERRGRCRQLIDPLAELLPPMRDIPILHISDHRRERMIGGMDTALETLDSARRARVAEEIFARIALLGGRGGETFAFDGQKNVIR